MKWKLLSFLWAWAGVTQTAHVNRAKHFLRWFYFFNPFVLVSLAHQFIERHQSNWSACIDSERARLFFSTANPARAEIEFSEQMEKVNRSRQIFRRLQIFILFRLCSVVADKNNSTDGWCFNSFYARIGDLINTIFGWQKTFRFLSRLKEKKNQISNSVRYDESCRESQSIALQFGTL